MSQYLVNLSLWSLIKEACRGHRRQTNVCRMLKAYCAFIALLLGCSAGALGQSPTGQSPTESGSARRIILGRSRPREIPQATLSCTPEEAT